MSKGIAGLPCLKLFEPRSTLYDHVYCPREMMECHAQNISFVSAIQERLWHDTTDIVRQHVLSNGYDYMTRLTLSDRVFCPRAIMACHARHCLTACAIHWLCEHATLDFVRPYVLSKVNHCMLGLTSSKVYSSILRPTACNRVCSQTAMMACHAQRRPTVCFPWAMMVCHTYHCSIVCAVKGLRGYATSDFVVQR